MAYRNFSEVGLDMAAGTAAAVDAPAFSDLEWTVIEIARQDPLSSIDPPGRFAGKLAWLMGSERRLPLADPRLEALRRFVVVERNLGNHLPDQEVARFVGAGFTRGHVRRLRTGSSYR